MISLIKGGNYEDLNLGVGEALTKREAVCGSASMTVLRVADSREQQYSGIYTCSPQDRLQTILEIIRDHRVHRFVIVDERNRLQGVLALSDIMSYLLYHGAKDDPPMPSRTARA